MLHCSCSLYNTFGIILAISAVIYAYFRWTYTYWTRRNLFYISPTIPKANARDPIHHGLFSYLKLTDAYHTIKKAGYKHAGIYIFTSPQYLVIHPDYIKLIMTQHFRHFASRGGNYNEKGDPLSAHLLVAEYEKWKPLRAKLLPTFTSGKLKIIFPTLLDCTLPMTDHISKLCAKNETLDIKELIARFSIDVIGSCAFGVECNSFKNANSEFNKYCKKASQPGKLHLLKMFAMMIMPNIAHALNLSVIEKDVSEFFFRMVKTMVEYRESGSYPRRDLMQLLVELKNQEDGITLDQLAAQVYLFFHAGFDTSSTTIAFLLYEVAKHQVHQNKVREEIECVLKKYDDCVTYESLGEMKYLEQVINETLRKYPPVPLIPRICTENYQVPDTDVIIEKGTPILIPVYGIHHDPEYYSEPNEFIPDRFSEENKSKIPPFTFMPFGDGPRMCIAVRFGMVVIKSCVVTILRRFRVQLNPKTPDTLKMKPIAFTLTTRDTIYLDAEEI